jgi:hypothetical protein
MCIHCYRNVFTEPLPGNDKRPWKAAELKVVFSLHPNPTHIRKPTLLRTIVTGQSVCKNQRLGRPQFWPHYFGFQSSGVTYNKQDDLRR